MLDPGLERLQGAAPNRPPASGLDRRRHRLCAGVALPWTSRPSGGIFAREKEGTRPGGGCGWPRGSRSFASSSAPRRDRASVAFGLGRKSCPQGQLATGDDTPFPGTNDRGCSFAVGGRHARAADALCMGEHRRVTAGGLDRPRIRECAARAHHRVADLHGAVAHHHKSPLGRIASARATSTRHHHVDCRRDAAGGRATHGSPRAVRRRRGRHQRQRCVDRSEVRSSGCCGGATSTPERSGARPTPPQPNDRRHATADDQLPSTSLRVAV